MSNIINEHVKFTHTNAVLLDPFISDISLVTLNKDYLPIVSANSQSLKNRTDHPLFKEPPGYLSAVIKVYYKGNCEYTIPMLFPESASESYGASFVKESPVGSTYPILAFANSGASTVNISFVALSDHLPKGYSTLSDYLNAIKQMTRPKYSGTHVIGPEVTVSLANITFSGVCDSISIDYQNLYGDNSYSMATITCQFTRTS